MQSIVIGKVKIKVAVFVILCLAVLVQCRLVTDRWTDGQTHSDSIYRASIAHGKNHSPNVINFL